MDRVSEFLYLKGSFRLSVRARFLLSAGAGVEKVQVYRRSNTVPSGNTHCGRLSPNVWSTVTLNIETVSRTFDVLINGAATSCTGTTADIQPPFNLISVMDALNLSWGGTVRFDNIGVETP